MPVFAQNNNEQVYIQRLATLKSQVDMTYSAEVKKHIDAHQKKLKGKKKQTPGYKILVPAFTPSTN